MAWFRRKAKSDERLLGPWKVDPTDAAALAALGQVSIDFDDTGNLNYIVASEGKSEIILMTYLVDGSSIITDQPSHPNEQRTKYEISEDGVLTLSFEGEPSRFVRPVGH